MHKRRNATPILGRLTLGNAWETEEATKGFARYGLGKDINANSTGCAERKPEGDHANYVQNIDIVVVVPNESSSIQLHDVTVNPRN